MHQPHTNIFLEMEGCALKAKEHDAQLRDLAEAGSGSGVWVK
jgi:hypothetical protein